MPDEPVYAPDHEITEPHESAPDDWELDDDWSPGRHQPGASVPREPMSPPADAEDCVIETGRVQYADGRGYTYIATSAGCENPLFNLTEDSDWGEPGEDGD